MTARGILRLGFFPVGVGGERFLLYEIGSADSPVAFGLAPLELDACAACGMPITGEVERKGARPYWRCASDHISNAANASGLVSTLAANAAPRPSCARRRGQ